MKKLVAFSRKEDQGILKEIAENPSFTSYFDSERSMLTIYVPDADLDSVIDSIRNKLDLRYKENIIEVSTPDFVISSSLARIDKGNGEAKTPVEKLLDSTRQYTSLNMSKFLLTMIATLIALIGLFLNNEVIIVGAMLLSPLLGPIYSFSINLGLGKVKNALKSITTLVIMLASAIIVVTGTTFLAGHFIDLTITSQINSRIVLSPLYIPMAIMLGFASILAMTRGIPEVFAGVAISVALVPPAAVAGIMISLDPGNFIFPFTIVAQNVIGMMAGALLAVIALNIGPRKYYEKVVARRLMIRGAIIVAILIIITITPLLRL